MSVLAVTFDAVDVDTSFLVSRSKFDCQGYQVKVMLFFLSGNCLN